VHEVKVMADGRSLDLSFNNIRHVPSLPSLKKVNVMYLVQNKIGKVDEGVLDWAKDTLTSLELGGNRIRVGHYPLSRLIMVAISVNVQAIENLEQLTLLEELWLGKNKIRTLEVRFHLRLYQEIANVRTCLRLAI